MFLYDVSDKPLTKGARIKGDNAAHLFMHGKEVGALMEGSEGWSKHRPAIIVVTILVSIISSIFLYVYSERGHEGFIDWFFNGIIGLMFTGFMIMFVFPLFEKLYDYLYEKLFKKQED